MNCMHLFLCRQPAEGTYTHIYTYAATQAVMQAQPHRDIDLIASVYSIIYACMYIQIYTLL